MGAFSRDVLTLPNRARLVFDPMPGLRTTALGVWLGAGARYERANENGLAHFLEHMAFKSAGGQNALQIAEFVESRGAVMNAATDYERTSYTMRCLEGDAADMLNVALSLVFAPDHPENEIEREKGVVLQEIGESSDQPDDLVFELSQAAAYGDHPLGRPILGTQQTLQGIKRSNLFEFAEANYAPARTVISVTGAFDKSAIEDVVRKWMDGRQEREAPAVEPAHSPAARWHAEARDVEQCHLVLSRPAPASTSDDRFAARLFAEIFGGGMASRLFQQVREERGLAYTIDATCDQYSDAGRLTVYAGCAPEDAMDVAKITASIWGDLASAGPTREELARAKAVMKAQFAMSAEAPAMRAGSAAYELLTFDRLIEIEEILDRIDAVDRADVQRIAGEAVAGVASAAAVGPRAGLGVAEAFLSL
ncbi:MAG: insulinase family protein [Alphaproteobacteria bacterium]|nr:insulinase family protein [Alphaproteobacteria bacterium]